MTYVRSQNVDQNFIKTAIKGIYDIVICILYSRFDIDTLHLWIAPT